VVVFDNGTLRVVAFWKQETVAVGLGHHTSIFVSAPPRTPNGRYLDAL
jgi:hypothetical protein